VQNCIKSSRYWVSHGQLNSGFWRMTVSLSTSDGEGF